MLDNHDAADAAFGSHNLRSIAHAIAYAGKLGLPAGAYEVQMLQGMAEPLRHALIERGERVRVYLPVGELIPGMAYLIRRLLENTSNVSFLRETYVDAQDLDRLKRPSPTPAPPRSETKSPVSFHHEPSRDFSREESREAFGRALDAAHASRGVRHALWIAGDLVWQGAPFESRNPADPEEVICTVPTGIADRSSA